MSIKNAAELTLGAVAAVAIPFSLLMALAWFLSIPMAPWYAVVALVLLWAGSQVISSRKRTSGEPRREPPCRQV